MLRLCRSGPLRGAVLAGLSFAGPAQADYRAGAEAYDGGDYATALRAWRTAAEAGDAEAQVALANLLTTGEGVRADLKEAVRWYRKAAARCHPVAQLNLGDFLSHGYGTEKNLPEAFLWLSLSAQQGIIPKVIDNDP